MERTNIFIYGFIFIAVVASAAGIAQVNLSTRSQIGATESEVRIVASANISELFIDTPSSRALPTPTLVNEIRDSILKPAPVSPALAKNNNELSLGALSAQIFLITEVGGGELIGKNADAPWPLASLTKLMTAVIAIEELGGSQEIVFSEAAIGQEGSAGGFVAGEIYTVSDVVAAMLLASSNDGAFALEEAIGSVRFIDLMRAKAIEIGMSDSLFTDSTGLSFLNQGTAHDMVRLISDIRARYPQILKMTQQKEISITERGAQTTHTIISIHPYAGKKGFLGGKTGYTEAANGNLVSLFEINGKTYLVSVFGSNDRSAETQQLYEWLFKTLDI